LSAKNTKPAAYVSDLTRCQVCRTMLTRYPLDYATCPKCGKVVCRQCWSDAWVPKEFSAEKCNHADKSMGPAVSPMAQKIRGPVMDWPKIALLVVAAAAVVGLLIFLWDLLAF